MHIIFACLYNLDLSKKRSQIVLLKYVAKIAVQILLSDRIKIANSTFRFQDCRLRITIYKLRNQFVGPLKQLSNWLWFFQCKILTMATYAQTAMYTYLKQFSRFFIIHSSACLNWISQPFFVALDQISIEIVCIKPCENRMQALQLLIVTISKGFSI